MLLDIINHAFSLSVKTHTSPSLKCPTHERLAFKLSITKLPLSSIPSKSLENWLPAMFPRLYVWVSWSSKGFRINVKRGLICPSGLGHYHPSSLLTCLQPLAWLIKLVSSKALFLRLLSFVPIASQMMTTRLSPAIVCLAVRAMLLLESYQDLSLPNLPKS